METGANHAYDFLQICGGLHSEGIEMTGAVVYDFFRRKTRIIFLILAIYAALC